MKTMQPREPFSALSVPLAGTQLIEASAGTGKTHTIADLFIRLLLERTDIQVSQILAVTYTEAATAELQDRIRKKNPPGVGGPDIRCSGRGHPD